jgi:tRNA (cmo5U34)-methyltransferase
MLMALRAKFKEKDLTLICGSYFDTAFENETYDAVLSVESLHHYTVGEKIKLYARLQNALKPNGFFILTDYFALSNAVEASRRQELNLMKKELAVREDALYHYDTPLTVAHETEALLAAGFSSVRVLRQWSSTCTLKAKK